MANLEEIARRLTVPINGQYPRPWMTASQDPAHARVFIVGRNQATPFTEELAGGHADYIDALFNRNGRSCRGLYEALRRAEGKEASPTRDHIDQLSSALAREGVDNVLETNVVCYSTGMSADLARPEHGGGRQRGTEIFMALLDSIRPLVLIAHGSGTHKDLGRLLKAPVPDAPSSVADGVQRGRITTRLESGPYEATVIALPSLAPPAYNRWAGWASEHYRDVADAVREELATVKAR